MLPTLHTDRLLLRPLQMRDLKHLYRLDGDPAVMRYIGDTRSPAQVRLRYIPLIEQYNYKVDDYGVWAAQLTENQRFIGWFCFKPLDDTSLIEVGYRLLPEYWRRGYATEGARRLVRYGFEEQQLDRVVGVTRHDNIGSQKALQNAGLQLKGERWFYEQTVWYYELLRDEYEQLHNW